MTKDYDEIYGLNNGEVTFLLRAEKVITTEDSSGLRLIKPTPEILYTIHNKENSVSALITLSFAEEHAREVLRMCSELRQSEPPE